MLVAAKRAAPRAVRARAKVSRWQKYPLFRQGGGGGGGEKGVKPAPTPVRGSPVQRMLRLLQSVQHQPTRTVDCPARQRAPREAGPPSMWVKGHCPPNVVNTQKWPKGWLNLCEDGHF